MTTQKQLARSSSVGDVEGQTRHLFHRVVHDDTQGVRGTALNAAAFEGMQQDQTRSLFGPDSAMLDSLVGCLNKHAANMRNDSHLQRQVQRLRNDVSVETLWRVATKLFNRVQDVWTGILALFAFGMELCRQMVVDIYDYIAATISSFIGKLASSWITQQGGWLALLCNGVAGMLGAVVEGAGRLLGVSGGSLGQRHLE